ncbi:MULTISPECIES: prephenate dehydrogenase [unclassified Paenibacillus]|uniref:prephenate dehydrogenase n=1 Tax=unclassified Paenibacillus TaxID=185978 RepID=UPI000953F9ED|nr:MULTISPECIES: prephenate dehydrogenase [unclassified Paenibacillus]ASS65138.1 prephenate dehydrogenase [Paenibacillus sp. RUD330]SIQ46910.1 prephenate dehydrogenase [Paenibacillus sp. RU4X]SIQ68798.1 prephenate dehydrogenase [Paenibacillus sp. RU4T]
MDTRIAVIGAGLIGGSLALCFKGMEGFHVTGYSYRQESADKYLKLHVVDEATTSLEAAVQGADFIFLCVPVGLIGGYLAQLGKLPLKPGCIITDVGSTKAGIMDAASQCDLGRALFIGGHPMAGSERAGVEAASRHLFENAFYILTPDPAVPEEAVGRLSGLLALTNARVVSMDPVQHDRIVGAISHLPHLIAVALVNQVQKRNEDSGMYAMLAAGGFRDITRIASSDPTVWRDILLDNRDVVLDLLDEWKGEMSRFADILRAGDGEAVSEAFRSAGEFRDSLPERRRGVLQSVYECYMDVPDHPGIIGKIATELGNRRINLSNLQIIESREDVPGVLRLSFRTQGDLDQAVGVLEQFKYTVKF